MCFYRNIMKIPKPDVKTLNADFQLFKSRITQSRKQDTTYFVSQISKFEKRYKKAGLERSFAENIFRFAEQMKDMGIADFPGIIYSSLMKMPFIKPQVKEFYAKKGLEYAREQGDLIHMLSRLVDLEKMYKQSGETHKHTDTLFEQEKVLSQICRNFKDAKKNYKTHTRGHSPLKKYEMELAKTRVDISKVLLKKNPSRAKSLLIKARKIFEREGRDKEVEFVNLMLSEINPPHKTSSNIIPLHPQILPIQQLKIK